MEFEEEQSQFHETTSVNVDSSSITVVQTSML
jgi:hypothetical protein